MIKVIRFAFVSAIAFGIGELLYNRARSLQFVIEFQPYWVRGITVLTVVLLGLAARGAIGGLALGLVLGKSKKALGLFAGGGFIVGSILASLAPSNIWWLSSGIEGAVVGIALGLALKNRRNIVGLAVAGALGYGIGIEIFGHYLSEMLSEMPEVSSVMPEPTLMTPFDRLEMFFFESLPGIIGGALLGVTLAYLDKE